jgi:hypothetical protein
MNGMEARKKRPRRFKWAPLNPLSLSPCVARPARATAAKARAGCFRPGVLAGDAVPQAQQQLRRREVAPLLGKLLEQPLRDLRALRA